jgi:hypothetical protein
LGDIGGLAEVLYLSAGSLMFYLSGLKLNALMINRLYHVSSTDSDMKDLTDRIRESTGKNKNSEKLITRTNGDIAIGVPTFLSCELVAHYVFCCCRKRLGGFTEYKEAIDMGTKSF